MSVICDYVFTTFTERHCPQSLWPHCLLFHARFHLLVGVLLLILPSLLVRIIFSCIVLCRLIRCSLIECFLCQMSLVFSLNSLLLFCSVCRTVVSTWHPYKILKIFHIFLSSAIDNTRLSFSRSWLCLCQSRSTVVLHFVYTVSKLCHDILLSLSFTAFVTGLTLTVNLWLDWCLIAHCGV